MISCAQTNAALPTETRCSKCQRVQPIGNFRRRFRGRDDLRESECNECRNIRLRASRLKGCENRIHKFVRKMQKATDEAKVIAICGGMCKKFGGVDGFVQAWFGAYQAANKRHPGSSMVTNSLLAIMRLSEICQQLRPQQHDLTLLSDEDLERARMDAARRVFAERNG